MNPFPRTLALWAAMLLMAGCASYNSKPIRVDSYTVTRPQGEDWNLTERRSGHVRFEKFISRGALTGSDISAEAQNYDVGQKRFKNSAELAAWFEKGVLVTRNGGQVKSQSVTPESSQDLCAARFEITLENVKVQKHPGKAFVETYTGRVVVDPKYPRYMVILTVRARVAPGESHAIPRDEALSYLESLNFVDMAGHLFAIPAE
jgi:hypothetical protein